MIDSQGFLLPKKYHRLCYNPKYLWINNKFDNMENNKTTPKDFFLHLGMIVALYVVVGNFINLAFKVINKAFPEVDYAYFSSSDISLPVATLIIIFPIFTLISWLIYKTYRQIPEKKNLWVRRWLTYVTLFFAGVFWRGTW